MLQEFDPGDVLIFQLESGYALLRVLAVDETDGETVWHIAAYSDLFLDVDGAENALQNIRTMPLSLSHVALTNRAFESTQVARIANAPLTEADVAPLAAWRNGGSGEISDRSVRLMLGLR